MLESAALRGARKAQAQEHPLLACRFWAAFGRVTNDRVKYQRNLGQTAFAAAHRAELDGDLAEARVLWGYVLLVEPQSEVAAGHFQTCTQRLAGKPDSGDEFVLESWEFVRGLLPETARGDAPRDGG